MFLGNMGAVLDRFYEIHIKFLPGADEQSLIFGYPGANGFS
jgi:hypothetical protein